MLKKIITYLVVLATSIVLIACGAKGDAKKVDIKQPDTSMKKIDTSQKALSGKKVEGRWYTSAQLIRGKKVFKTNCAACHGANGQGLVADWKKPDATGKFPAPPLNGTAHAWHHSKDLLKRTVNEGGIALGGTMPPFKDKLTDQEKEAVLAHVMSLWPEDIYKAWQKRNPATK